MKEFVQALLDHASTTQRRYQWGIGTPEESLQWQEKESADWFQLTPRCFREETTLSSHKHENCKRSQTPTTEL